MVDFNTGAQRHRGALKPYGEYRETGLAWLPTVPKGWRVERFKRIVTSIRKGHGITKEDVVANGDTPCVRYGEIYTKYNGSFDRCYSRTNKSLLSSPQYFSKGDILFSCTGELVEEIGKNIVYLGDQPCLAGGDIIIASHKEDAKFLNYYLNSSPAQSQKSCGKFKLKVVHIHWMEIGNIVVALPPPDEQRAIVAYLDEKTAKMDRLIALKEREVALLNEKKQAMISRVVTRGLDPNAELVDSGVDWIGKVPKGWRVGMLKLLSRIMTGTTPPMLGADEYFSNDEGVPWIKAENLGYNKPIITTAQYITPSGLNFIRMFPANTVYVCCIASVGKVGFSALPSTCNQQINGMIFNEDVYSWKYGFYATISASDAYNFAANGNVIKILNAKGHGEIHYPLPPLAEQRAIVAYLDEATAKIDRAVAAIEKSIELLKERKTRLVSDVVTGKVDVRYVSGASE